LWDPSLPSSITAPPAVAPFKAGVGPSFGFAYSPQSGGFLTGNGRTVIRGGYRLSYDPAFYNILLNNYGSAPSTLQAVIPGDGTPATQLPAVPSGPLARTNLLPLAPQGDPRELGETTVPSSFRPDQVSSWSLGIQREVSKNAAIELRYVGNHGSQLFQTVNANPFLGTAANPGLAQIFPNLVPAGLTPCPLSQAFDGANGEGNSVAEGRVNCNEGVVLSRGNTGSSNYQALQTEFRANNLFHQLTLRANYTFSKTLDNASEIFSTVGGGSTISLAQNPLDPQNGEYSLSGLDFPHTFTLTAVEQIPLFKEQHGFVGHMLGGWSLSGSYVWESGQTFTPLMVSAGSFQDGDFFDSAFLNQFSPGSFDPARPFRGNSSAPVDSVGIFCADAIGPTNCAANNVADNGLISLNSLNAKNSTVVAVTNQQVRYIANTGISETVFGTPFGNVPRDDGRDAPLNYLNASVTKLVKFNERASFEFRFTALNALNHANFATVTPIVETAGNGVFGNSFALPQFTGDSIPGSNLAASRRFYFGGVFRF
jgi:hypothetical protein